MAVPSVVTSLSRSVKAGISAFRYEAEIHAGLWRDWAHS